jgi:hypothetical protein
VADEVAELQLFVEIIKAGNLSAAARALNSSPAAMSRGLSALRRQCSTTWFRESCLRTRSRCMCIQRSQNSKETNGELRDQEELLVSRA